MRVCKYTRAEREDGEMLANLDISDSALTAAKPKKEKVNAMKAVCPAAKHFTLRDF